MKTVIIWGSEGGIGRAILQEFLDQGWQTIAAARQLSEISDQAHFAYAADFTQPGQVDRIAEALAQQGVEIDVFVYAAGDIGAVNISGADQARWLEILENNLTGVFQTLRASLPLLVEEGHIFFLGAVSERLKLPGLTAYVAAKAGLEALAVSLSKEERKKKVTVIRPGAVDTEIWEKVPFKKPSHTYQPAQVAERIWQAYEQGETGQVDLV